MRNSNKSSKSQQIYIFSTKQNSTMLSNIWDTITNFFKTDEIVEPQINDKEDSLIIQFCKCPKTINSDYCDNIYEIMQMTKNFNNKRIKELYQNLLHLQDKSLDSKGDNLRQIKKDTTRTYASNANINQKDILLNKLENVLRAFSNYDNSIKYCQGMNFIVGFFLYHCEEHIAFWLFVSLIEEYELSYLFMENFPGLSLHVKRLEAILQNEYPYYWATFKKIGVKVEIFLVEWLFSLFSSLIPIDLQMDFYKGFFSQGWLFFYKMCISCILNVKGNFSEADEIYISLKNGKHEENIKVEDMQNSWKKIIQKADSIIIKTKVMNINN